MKKRSLLKTASILAVLGVVPSLMFAGGTSIFEDGEQRVVKEVKNNKVEEQIKNNVQEQLNSIKGLDKIVRLIKLDEGLRENVTEEDLEIAIESAEDMNRIIIEAIIATGVANDRKISAMDARVINDYIVSNYQDAWAEYHGDDNANAHGAAVARCCGGAHRKNRHNHARAYIDETETGYHKIQGDGGVIILYGKNAVNTVFDGVYHLGFEPFSSRFLANEDGNRNASFASISKWLNGLLRYDLAHGRLVNSRIKRVIGTTNTGFDRIIEIINSDRGLERKVPLTGINIAAKNANEMNKLILEAIYQTDPLENGKFTATSILMINDYLVRNYADKWIELHGNDENVAKQHNKHRHARGAHAGKCCGVDRLGGQVNNIETGYHRIQGDGAVTKFYGQNAINTVFDGIYHLGFSIHKKNGHAHGHRARNARHLRLLNEDGNANAAFVSVARWLNKLLEEDLLEGIVQ